MKKLLILMLVLGMASSASAVLDPSWLTTVNGTPWTGGSVVDVALGDEILVTLHEGTTTTIFGGVNQLGFNVDHGDYVASSLGNDQPTYSAWSILLEGVVNVDGFDNKVGLSLPTGGLADFDVLYWKFDVPTDLAISSSIVVSCFSGSYFGAAGGGPAAIGDLTLNVIPEPMTIALLGLGSLFLLRRRK